MTGTTSLTFRRSRDVPDDEAAIAVNAAAGCRPWALSVLWELRLDD